MKKINKLSLILTISFCVFAYLLLFFGLSETKGIDRELIKSFGILVPLISNTIICFLICIFLAGGMFFLATLNSMLERNKIHSTNPIAANVKIPKDNEEINVNTRNLTLEIIIKIMEAHFGWFGLRRVYLEKRIYSFPVYFNAGKIVPKDQIDTQLKEVASVEFNIDTQEVKILESVDLMKDEEDILEKWFFEASEKLDLLSNQLQFQGLKVNYYPYIINALNLQKPNSS